ncbi:GNAT family N-acetyltransferase [Paenibacillus sp. HN-1]|uniref:GNAT family N-acetyltransferase n=1 Tax=Paenibacillus TaxID=44249 RepID=UPI001CA9B4DD|nr:MULTISPECIES: GNAT family N-acetyltransferase [Paenibacillus]MBY9078838.1 GNAT family N-acetyltransferase [Paenibacillus sp. CGMCC 1.18879]MBY9086280.1 GNAT family N-acetyltransferase [Paenibacillus sinensis]
MKVLETERLIIRQYTTGDFDVIYGILSDPVTMSFWPKPFDKEQVTHWIERNMRSYQENGFGRWLIVLKERDVIIGDCGIMKSEINSKLENDLGYIIDQHYWKQGYGTEAARACMHYAFDGLQLDSICINMPVDHVSSRRVAELIGMKLETEFNNSRNRNIRTYLFRKDRKSS